MEIAGSKPQTPGCFCSPSTTTITSAIATETVARGVRNHPREEECPTPRRDAGGPRATERAGSGDGRWGLGWMVGPWTATVRIYTIYIYTHTLAMLVGCLDQGRNGVVWENVLLRTWYMYNIYIIIIVVVCITIYNIYIYSVIYLDVSILHL